MDHLTRGGTPFSMYTPNLVKISSSAPETCPQNNSKKHPLATKFYFRFQRWHHSSFVDLCMCHYTKFQWNRTIGGQVIAMLPFYPLGLILSQKVANNSQSWETHSQPVSTMWYAHHPWQVFYLNFWKSFPLRNDEAPKTTGVEMWVNIWDLLLTCKNRGGLGRFLCIFMEFSQGSQRRHKTTDIYPTNLNP